MSNTIQIAVTTVTGDTFTSTTDTASDEQVADVRDLLGDLKDLDNLRVETSATTTVYFRPEHVVAVALTVTPKEN